jgi:hypothetical protein
VTFYSVETMMQSTIIFSSVFIFINTAGAEGGLSARTEDNDTNSEDYYQDDYYEDDVDVDLVGPAGVTGAVRRHDRRDDRRDIREDVRERPRHR